MIEAGQLLIQEVSRRIQETAHEQIATVVTRAIQSVFDARYEFRIDFDKKRGKTEAVPYFLKDGQRINPMDGAGGGLLDVTSFALRLVCVLLRRPSLRRFLALDEPFRHLDRTRAVNVKELMLELTRELDFQILQITHSRELACGTIIEL